MVKDGMKEEFYSGVSVGRHIGSNEVKLKMQSGMLELELGKGCSCW